MPTDNVNDQLGMHLRISLRPVFGTWRGIGFLSVLAVLTGFVAPFGTYETWHVSMQYGYWFLVVFTTAAVGHGTATTAEFLLNKTGLPKILQSSITALSAALSVCLALLVIWWLFGFPITGSAIVGLYIDCVIVVGCVMILSGLLSTATSNAETSGTGADQLLVRLPSGKRGRLIRLSAQDHYVEVVTDAGSTLVAMRFRDAMKEIGAEAGVQVHRSHWVAEHAILGRARRSHGTSFRLKDGSLIPIGRSFKSALQKRGLLV